MALSSAEFGMLLHPEGVERVQPGVSYLFSVLSESFSLLSFVPDHTVPYGTVVSRDDFPGTSCQATIGVVPPGRAGRHPQQQRGFLQAQQVPIALAQTTASS